MKASKVVLATDFSEHSDTALRLATSLARDTGAMLLITHVMPPPLHAADRGFTGYAEGEDEAARQKQLDEVRPTDSEVGFAHHLLHGQPAEEVVRFAEDEKADMIVIGSHGRRGVTRLLLGSVAEHIVRHAACPVMTVKHSDRTPDED